MADLSWSEQHHVGENAAALRWLRERGLIEDGAARHVIATGPAREIPRSVAAYLAEHAVSGYNDHRIGMLLLRWLRDLDGPMRPRATAAADVARDMLRPGSEPADICRSIEAYYDPLEGLSPEQADHAARRDLERAAPADSSPPVWTSSTRSQGKRVGDTVTFARKPVFGIGAVAASLLLGALPATDVVAEGSGWIPIWAVISIAGLVFGVAWLIRRPRLVLAPAGLTVVTPFRTRHVTWSQLQDADVDPNTNIVSLDIRDIGSTRRVRLRRFGADATDLHAEIRSYWTERGGRFSAEVGVLVPRAEPSRMLGWASGIGSVAALVLVIFVMPWGFGLCRGGDCGEGVVIAYLATKVSTDGVEAAIEEDLRDEHSNASVRCPDRVDNDPNKWFTCELQGAGDAVRARASFTSRTHHDVEWRYVTAGG